MYMKKLVTKFERLREKFTHSQRNQLVPHALSRLHEYAALSAEYVVEALQGDVSGLCDGMYIVRHCRVTPYSSTRQYIASFKDQSCSCGEWQDTLFPCRHALSISRELGTQ